MSTLGTLSLIASQLCACAPGKDGRSSQAAADGSVGGGRRNSDEWDLFQHSDVDDVPGTTVPWSGGLIEYIHMHPDGRRRNTEGRGGATT
jgi:hypothetical protein